MGNLLTFRLLAAATPSGWFRLWRVVFWLRLAFPFGLLAFCTIERVLQQQLKYPKLKRLWDGLHQFDNFLNFLFKRSIHAPDDVPQDPNAC